MQSQLKILFVDDHAGLRDGLAFLLNQKLKDVQFITASTYVEAIDALRENSDIHSVILDLNLDGKNGLELIPEFRTIQQEINILVYSMYNDPIHIENAIKANIQGYISKDADIDELEAAITTICKGSTYFNKQASKVMRSLLFGASGTPETSDEVTQCFRNYKTLTKKEQETFLLLVQKKEINEIARTYGTSEKTVLNSRSIIYQKMQVKDRLELIEAAKKLGVIL